MLIEFSLPIFILALLFHAGFSHRRLVSREPIFWPLRRVTHFAESYFHRSGFVCYPREPSVLIGVAPDPLHLRRSRLDPMPDRLFSSRAKDTVLHPRFAARGFPAHSACRGLQSSLSLFPVEHMSCSLGSSKGSILVQISCGLLQDLVPVYS
jgi:hypothetical protein